MQVQPQYPRVVELIARKTECLRVEQPRLKVVSWENMRSLVRDDVNKLLSDRQLAFVLKCLTNAGVVSWHIVIQKLELVLVKIYVNY